MGDCSTIRDRVAAAVATIRRRWSCGAKTAVILGTGLGELADVNPGVVENLFSADLAYLQDLYRRVNSNGHSRVKLSCPECENVFEVEESALLGGEPPEG